jgi:hypothetical protein
MVVVSFFIARLLDGFLLPKSRVLIESRQLSQVPNFGRTAAPQM